METERQLLTAAQVAERLSLKESTIRAWLLARFARLLPEIVASRLRDFVTTCALRCKKRCPSPGSRPCPIFHKSHAHV